MKKYLLNNEQKVKDLAERLTQLKTMNGKQKISQERAWEIAHAFSELEEDYTNFLEEKLPKLTLKDITDQELKDILLETSLDAQHIKSLLENLD